MLETTKEDRARLLRTRAGAPDGSGPAPISLGLMRRLIRDVDTLEEALEGLLLGFEALMKVLGPPFNNPTSIAGHEDALSRIAKARALLAP